jgi:hypothetical protein
LCNQNIREIKGMSLHKIDNREEKLTTKKITKCLEISLFVYLFINIVASTVSAEMVIKIPRPVSDQDTRYRYGTELLRQALEKTRTKFGDYRIEMAKNKMPEKRMRAELKEGIRINVHHLTLMTMFNQDYAIPILVPTLKGTLGYRIRPQRLGLDRRTIGCPLYFIARKCIKTMQN